MISTLFSLAIFLAAIGSASSAGSCPFACNQSDPECIHRSDRVIDSPRTILGAFHSLNIDDCINVHSVYSPNQSLVLTGDSNFLPFVTTTVVHGVLNIAIRDGIKIECQNTGCSNNELLIRIRSAPLAQISATGISSVKMFPDPRQPMLDHLSITAAGISIITAHSIARNTLLRTLEKGSINFDGRDSTAEGDHLVANAAGIGQLRMDRLFAANVHLEAHDSAVVYFNFFPDSHRDPRRHHNYDLLKVRVYENGIVRAASGFSWALDGDFRVHGRGRAFIQADGFRVRRLMVEMGPSETIPPSTAHVSILETLRACLRGTGNVVLHNGNTLQVKKHVTDEGSGDVLDLQSNSIGTEDHFVCYDF